MPEARRLKRDILDKPEPLSTVLNAVPEPLEFPELKVPPMANCVVSLYNHKMTVKLYPSKPTNLDSVDPSAPIDVDHVGGLAILGTKSGCYMWKYNSPVPDTAPFYYPYDQTSDKVTLLPPFAGETRPIVVVVNARGRIEFWKSNDPARFGTSDYNHRLFGLQQLKLNYHFGFGFWSPVRVDVTARSIDLGIGYFEQVKIVRSIEPVGVVVYTTFGSMFLVQLSNEDGGTRQFPRVLVMNRSLFFPYTGWSCDIVSIRSGQHSDERSECLLYTINSAGWLSIWQCNLTGALVRRVITELKQLVFPDIALLSVASVRFHDVASLSQHRLYVLASISPGENETQYLVASLSVELSTYKLKVESQYKLKLYSRDFVSRPQLLFPRPGNALYIVHDRLVIPLMVMPDGGVSSCNDRVNFPADFQIYGASVSSNGIALVSNRGVIGVEMRSLPGQVTPDGSIFCCSALRRQLEQVVLFPGESNMAALVLSAARTSSSDVRFAVESLAFDIYCGKLRDMGLGCHNIPRRRAYIHNLARIAVKKFVLEPDTRLMLCDMVHKLAVLDTFNHYICNDQELSVQFETATGVDWYSWISSKFVGGIEGIVSVLLKSSDKFHVPIIDALIGADLATQKLDLLAAVRQGTIMPWIASKDMEPVLRYFATSNYCAERRLYVGIVEVIFLAYSLRSVLEGRCDPEKASLLEIKAVEYQTSCLRVLTANGYRDDATRLASRFGIIVHRRF